MISTMEYKGYIGSIEYSNEDDVLFGKVQFINALINYEGQDVKKLREGFEYMVDEYLKDCKKKNSEPEKPFKGSFNIRVNPALHRDIARIAKVKGISLNNLVAKALEQTVQNYND